jgi:hypothetical protein
LAAATGLAADAPLPDPLAAGWQGKPVCEIVHDGIRQRVLRCTFPPGTGHERHFHAPHVGYVLEGGRMRITDADGTREVETTANSGWNSDGVAWHEVLNVGDTATSYLIIEVKDDD